MRTPFLVLFPFENLSIATYGMSISLATWDIFMISIAFCSRFISFRWAFFASIAASLGVDIFFSLYVDFLL